MSKNLFQMMVKNFKRDWILLEETKELYRIKYKNTTCGNQYEYIDKLTKVMQKVLNNEMLFVSAFTVFNTEKNIATHPISFQIIYEIEEDKVFRVDYAPESNDLSFGKISKSEMCWSTGGKYNDHEKAKEIVRIFQKLIDELPEYRLHKIMN
jgi:hypothetical protein